MKQYVEDTCEVMCEENGRRMVGELLDFKDRTHLSVSIDRTVKLDMKWTGHVYEGKKGGLSFSTEGPLVRAVRQGRK